MSLFAVNNLRVLTVVLLLIFLAVGVLAFLPQIRELEVGQLRLLAIGFAAVVLVVGMTAIRHTNRRLAQLSELTRAIELGDYSARSTVAGRDAIGQLSRAINEMAERTETVIADLQERTSEVQRLSTHDLQTGLPNRRLFHELLVKELAHAKRDRQKVGLMLDRMKRVGSSGDWEADGA